MTCWELLPAEIWEKILDLVDTTGLRSAQEACHTWSQIVIQYVLGGRLKNRALICERLVMVNNDLLDHRRALRNTLSLSLEKETNTVILCGVVVYTATDGELLDEEATVTFDWLTTTIKLFCGDNLIAEAEEICNTETARALVRRQLKAEGGRRLPHTQVIWFRPPLPIISPGVTYDLEHNLRPTDVTNHFSGFPVTTLGAELWTCYGKRNDAESVGFGHCHCVHAHRVLFRFGKSKRGGRCSLDEGQMPQFYFWIT